jgi:two-component sensor histidine kinase
MTTPRLLVLLICTILLTNMQAQQPFYTHKQHVQDSVRMQSLINETQRLPAHLVEIIATLDSMRMHLQKSNDPKDRNNLEGVDVFIAVLNDVEEKTQNAIRAYNQAKSVYEKLTDSPSASEYKTNRVLFGQLASKSEAAFSAISKAGKQGIRKIQRYYIRHYWPNESLILSFVDKYFEFAIDGKKQELDRKAADIRRIEAQKSDLEQDVNKVKLLISEQQTQQQGLVLDIDDLEEKQRKMNEQRQSLLGRIVKDSMSFQNLRMSIRQMEGELNINIRTKQRQEELIAALQDTASNLSRQVGEMNDKIRDFHTFEVIKRENIELGKGKDALEDTLAGYKDSLARTTEALGKAEVSGSETEQKKKENMLLFSVICSVLALGIIITQYLRTRFIKRAKRRLAEKNSELEEKNKEIEEKNRELEEKNRELEEKNQQLVDKSKLEHLVQRLHHSTEELNHRTKNNLQQVSAMLLMQEEETNDAKARDALQDARSRIDVLGILHRQLYETQRDNYTTMDLSHFLQKLTEHVVMANSSPRLRPETHLDVASIEVKMERAVQVGLVANELIQNCFKHAFKTTANPRIELTLRTIGKDIELSIRDNGPGMPPGAGSVEESTSFGLKLVHLIVSGIGGTIVCENDGGLVCKVVFPIDE